MTTYVAKEGSNWSQNSSWNDDMAWMIIAGLRVYQIVGNEAWLKIVTDTWNATYDRGWDTKYAGGGIWEDMGHITPWDKPSKCGSSNSPIVSMGVVLYQITAKVNSSWAHRFSRGLSAALARGTEPHAG